MPATYSWRTVLSASSARYSLTVGSLCGLAGSAMKPVYLDGRAWLAAKEEGRLLPPLEPCGPDRPATAALTRTSAAGVVVLLVLAVTVELPAAHGRLLRVGRRVHLQVAVVGVLARDLLQVLPRVAEGFKQRGHRRLPSSVLRRVRVRSRCPRSRDATPARGFRSTRAPSCRG